MQQRWQGCVIAGVTSSGCETNATAKQEFFDKHGSADYSAEQVASGPRTGLQALEACVDFRERTDAVMAELCSCPHCSLSSPKQYRTFLTGLGMIIELGPGNILVFLRGAAKARSLDRFVADLKGVTKSISSVMTRQPGYMGSMRLWNLDDSGDLLSIAHWDNLPERLAYEKNTSAGVRNDMETILEKTPQRPKFEVVRAANITQGEPRLARVLTATANAKSVQEFARDWAQVAPQPSLPAGGTGLLAEHVVCSIEGTAEVLVMELYANADAAQLPADQAVTLSNQCGRILRTPFASRCYAVVRTPA